MASTWSRGEPMTDWSTLDRGPQRMSALERLWRAFMTARCIVGVVLLLLQLVFAGLGTPPQRSAIVLAIGYLVLALAGARFLHPQPPIRRFGLSWLGAVGIDLAVFTMLQFWQGTSVSYSLLFALPVLMAAVVGTLAVGLGTAAAVTLLLLADAGWHTWLQPGDSSSRFVQAALTGTGLFAVALLAHQLALRLAREEAAAQRSRSNAQMHAQVNELVIETLSEGVLVLDDEGRVHAANPAAGAILGRELSELPIPFSLDTQPAWRPLAKMAQQTFRRRLNQAGTLPIAQAQGAPREVRVRTRLTPAIDGRAQSLCVMFLQDLREFEARIRTEKLAAMGRMSAAVAHEIRNPLAAISQASALLAEDLADPGHRRLTEMVQHNATRLARIVDEVLDMARARQQRMPARSEPIGLDDTVRRLAEEWVRQTHRQGVLLVLGAGATVRFDAEHLRRILVNLLDNAARYAGEREGSIQITTDVGADGRASLQVWSDGAPLEPAVERHLFEPFFSSESRSSGLGLFISRELCERHGATIAYERRPLAANSPEGNEFRLVFARLEDWAGTTAGTLFDTTIAP